MDARLSERYSALGRSTASLRNQPRDESPPLYRRQMLERYVEPIMLALRALGASPDTADQKPPPAPGRRKRYFRESVKDLIDAGLLKPGTRLRPMRRALDTRAIVRDDGLLEIDDKVFGEVSQAAQHVSGNTAESGWEFWAAPSGDGSLVSLCELRDRLRSGRVGPRPPQPEALPAREQLPRSAPSPAPNPRTPRRKRRFDAAVADLITAGLVRPGERLTSMRKALDVEAEVLPDGNVRFDDVDYRSLSAAAKAASGGRSEPGWEFWAVERDGRQVRLYKLRADYVAKPQPPRS